MLITTQQDQTQESLQRLPPQENRQLHAPSLDIQFHQQQQMQVMHRQQLHQQQQQQQQQQTQQSQQSQQPQQQPQQQPHHHQQQQQQPQQQPHHHHQQQQLQQQLPQQQLPQQQMQLQQQQREHHPQRQRHLIQQRILQQQQHGTLPLALSMSFESVTQRLDQPEQSQDGSQQKRGRFLSWSASTVPLTPLSADAPSLPVYRMNELGQTLYVEPQQYQQQLTPFQQQQQQNQNKHQQRQLISSTTIQSITPDHFLGNDFDWITEISDLGTTPASNKATHSRTTTDATTPISGSSISTPGVLGQNSNSNSSYEIFNTMVASEAVKSETPSLSSMAFSGLEMASIRHDSPAPSRQGRFQAQKEHIVSTAVTSTTNVDAQPPTPPMPTPLSPVSSLPESRYLNHTWQRGNVNVKREIHEPSVNALATPSANANANANSNAFYDILSLGSSTNTDSVFGQHQRVLSANSRDSRVGGSGGWGGQYGTSIPHARRPSNNSNSNHIVSSLFIQSAPRKEETSVEGQTFSSTNKKDHLISSRARNSNSSVHTSPDPDVEANQDIEASMEFKEISPSGNNEEDEESDLENSRPATCPFCNKEFQSKGLLRSHVVSHSSDRPFVCWDCTDKSYKRNHDLLRHRREKHNVDGVIVPSRGSSRNSGGRESAVDRITNQPTIASQNHIPHHEIIYTSHGMIYVGNRGLPELSPASSGSPLDPFGGVEYNRHNHSHSLYGPHSHTNPDLGLGLEMNAFEVSRLNLNSGGGAQRSSAHERRMSRGGGTGAISFPVGRKRKLSNASSTSPTVISTSSVMIMPPPPTPVITGSAGTSIITTVPAHPTPFHPSQQLLSLSGAFENLSAHMEQFGSEEYEPRGN